MFALLLFTSALFADPLSLGTFTLQNHHSQIILAAPHGAYDLNTETIVREVSQNLNCSSLLAIGFRTKAHPYNVNRPTEGIGLPSDSEIHSAGAQAIYAAYKTRIFSLQIQPALYVEIHGEGKFDERIEIATVGVTPEQAVKMKEWLQHALSNTEYVIAIEGVDAVSFQASANKKFGILKEVPIALHIELPWNLRFKDRALTVKALEEFLPKAAALLM